DNTTAHRNNRFTIRLLEIRTSGKVAPTELAPSVGREAYTRATQEGCLRFHPMTKASRPTSRHPTRQSWTPRLVLAVARPIPSPPVGAASATHPSTNRLSRRRPRARPSGLRNGRSQRGRHQNSGTTPTRTGHRTSRTASARTRRGGLRRGARPLSPYAASEAGGPWFSASSPPSQW